MRIKRVDLPEQNSKSVFDRMRAERQREAAEFRGRRCRRGNRIRADRRPRGHRHQGRGHAQGRATRGDGDAERNRIYADAYSRDPDFFGFYRSMQAYETGLKAGDTRLLLSPDSDSSNISMMH